MDDTISRAAAIETVRKAKSIGQAHRMLVQLPSAQLAQDLTKGCTDTISRAAVVDEIEGVDWYHINKNGEMVHGANDNDHQAWYKAEDIYKAVESVPSAQPERTCVNCGRTANNGGWYADGGTRCPIEEHYALPKDGYCHLWEKRNVTDDDYPERREDERLNQQAGGDCSRRAVKSVWARGHDGVGQ